MDSSSSPYHPAEFHSPSWDLETNRPIVDGKIHDPQTGEIRAAGELQYSGPPAVDIIIFNLHADTNDFIFRAQRPLPMEIVLGHVMSVINARKLEVDSVMATKYAIRVVLAQEMRKEVNVVFNEMVNGMWERRPL